jgi:hypothetical protein
MDNHSDITDMELQAFRSGRTYKEYCDSWVSVGPTDGRSASMSKADFLKAVMSGLNKLYGLDGDTQEKNT